MRRLSPQPSKKPYFQKLHSANRLGKNQAGIFAATFAVIGVSVLIASHAAGPTSSLEAENSNTTSPAATVSDAQASGGSALKFQATGSSCPGGQIGTQPNCFSTPPAPLNTGKHWTVPFYEEFNGTDYDHNKLTPCFDWNFGDCTSTFNNGYEHYLASQVTVSGGAAHLKAEPLSPPYSNSACYNGSCIYKSGLLSTARKSGNDPATAYLYKFTYGYVEANLKVVNQQGFFAAWWMLPADPSFSYHYDASGAANSNGAYRYEIDMLEMLGHDPTDMEMHYSWGDAANAYYSPNDTHKNGACANLDYSQGFHRFGVDWEPTFVAFYIDGVKCGQHDATPSQPVPNVPMQLILDQMVSNNWQRSVGKPLLNTTLTSDLQTDYIRVYQQAP
jgi:beta-glucanase (GH16 family)